jgi:hypothetical protein
MTTSAQGQLRETAVVDKTAHLDLPMMVLDIVANDYESFSTVIREVSEWAHQEQIFTSLDKIESTLRQLVADGVVLAYEYVANEQCFRPVELGINIEGLYFYATAAGIELLA